jgi:hypothetical protein
MTGIQKLSSVILLVIAGLSVVFAGFYYLGGSYIVGQFEAMNYTSLVLIWAVILFVIAGIATLLFSLVNVFSNPKVLKGFLIALGLTVVLVAISYFLASSESLGSALAETIKAPSPSTLKWVGTGLNATYILAIISFIGIIASEIYRAFQ